MYARIVYGDECQVIPKMKRVIQTKLKPWARNAQWKWCLFIPNPTNCWGRTGGAHDTLSVMEFYGAGGRATVTY